MPDATDNPLVLVVDDDPDICEMIAAVVEDLVGAQTITASNGVEAIDLVLQKHPDVILLDLTMPILDGYGVISQLRANPQTLTVPIIVVTADSSRGQQRAMALGANACLGKPFEDETLVQVIRQYLLARVGATARTVDSRVETLASVTGDTNGLVAGTRKPIVRNRGVIRKLIRKVRLRTGSPRRLLDGGRQEAIAVH